MKTFSQRNGLKKSGVIQLRAMDEPLRNSLWNCIYNFYIETSEEVQKNKELGYFKQSYEDFIKLHKFFRDYFFKEIWFEFFKKPLNELSINLVSASTDVRKYFFQLQWNEIYDFLEFVANLNFNSTGEEFKKYCNSVLERESSAYRFIGNYISEIISEIEIEEIEKAIEKSQQFEGVRTHLQTALGYLSDRKSPDYRNSIKESISSVESLVFQITGKDNFTLAIKEIEKKIKIHGALKEAFIRLYGYTGDKDGIRHALLEETDLDIEDAKFMLISCSAFINYLIVKNEKAKLLLNKNGF
jgi:hypothetical protein